MLHQYLPQPNTQDPFPLNPQPLPGSPCPPAVSLPSNIPSQGILPPVHPSTPLIPPWPLLTPISHHTPLPPQVSPLTHQAPPTSPELRPLEISVLPTPHVPLPPPAPHLEVPALIVGVRGAEDGHLPVVEVPLVHQVDPEPFHGLLLQPFQLQQQRLLRAGHEGPRHA